MFPTISMRFMLSRQCTDCGDSGRNCEEPDRKPSPRRYCGTSTDAGCGPKSPQTPQIPPMLKRRYKMNRNSSSSESPLLWFVRTGMVPTLRTPLGQRGCVGLSHVRTFPGTMQHQFVDGTEPGQGWSVIGHSTDDRFTGFRDRVDLIINNHIDRLFAPPYWTLTHFEGYASLKTPEVSRPLTLRMLLAD